MDNDTTSNVVSTSFDVIGSLYAIAPLIENVPEEYDYSCIEYYDKHIYLGTTSGKLLHYFELDAGNYTLISQLEFNDSEDSSIDRITLLPEIDRALVLSEGEVKLFLLPEFAPATNVYSIKNITDFCPLNYSKTSNAYPCFMFSNDTIIGVSVSPKQMKIEKTYGVKGIQVALPITDKRKLMGAVDNTYSIIDPQKESTIPLFKVCEEDAKELTPTIANFGKNEYIVICGISNEESCMGLILNDEGEITQGTIVIEKYPTRIAVEYPYVFAELHGSKTVNIHMLKENDDPEVVQSISREDPFHISKTQRSFPAKYYNKQLVELLRYVPLTGEKLQFREDQEKAYVERNIDIETDMLLYGKDGISYLQQKPNLLNITSFGEETIPTLEKYISLNPLSNYSKLEHNYFHILYILMLVFHCNSIDETLIEKWLRCADVVDIRILLYFFDFKIYGDLWIPNGLLEFTEKLHQLKLIHKCKDVRKVLHFLKRRLKEESADGLKDSANIYLSLDIILLHMDMKERKVNIKNYEDTSYHVIIEELSKEEDDYAEVLLELYEQLNDIEGILKILRRKDSRRLIKFMKDNVDKLPETYSEEDMIKDISTALKSNHEFENNEVVYDVLELMKILSIDTTKFTSRIEDSEMKAFLLEKLGVTTTKDLDFLYQYYKTKLTNCNKKLMDSMNIRITSYVTNLNYDKPTLKKYLQTKLDDSDDYSTLLDVGRKLIDVEKRLNETKDSFLDEIDATYILRLLLVETEDLEATLGSEKLLELYLSWNDFSAVDTIVEGNEESILQILDHYVSLKNETVLCRFLVRNKTQISSMHSNREVFEKIPPTIPLNLLQELLFPVFRRNNNTMQNLHIEKGILKHYLQALKGIERRLEP